MIDLLYFTHNRLAYTILTLPSVYSLVKKSGLLNNFIILDDASIDGTLEFVYYFKKHVDPSIKILSHYLEGNWLSFSYGVRLIETDIFACMDNDILVYDGWIELLYNTILKFPKLGTLGDPFGYQERKTEDVLVKQDNFGYYKYESSGTIGVWRKKLLEDFPPTNFKEVPLYGCCDYQCTVTDYNFGYVYGGRGFPELRNFSQLSRFDEYAKNKWSREKRTQ